MSWSFSVTNTPLFEMEGALDAAAEEHFANLRADSIREMVEQTEVAVTAVLDILASDTLGHGPFSVYLSGHANPYHMKRSGWANDCISIRIEQQ